jgi:Cu-processing system ATP-binding protein
MISIYDITKKFGKLEALRHINLVWQAGHAYGLIGPNGSGKTTLIKCILGLVIPGTGTIQVDGEPTSVSEQYRRKIGYMPQLGRYPDNMTVGQVIDMMKAIRPDTAVHDEDLLRAFELPTLSHKRMRTLSGGTRQKVSAALAFLFSPAILILDEPTAGLDPIASELLKEKIIHEKEKGKLIVITSHILSDLDELITDIVYLQEGRVHYQNTINHLKQHTGESRLNKAIAHIMRMPEVISVSSSTA